MTESMEIKRLDSLKQEYVVKTADLLVESFYDMFKGISKNKDALKRVFMPCMELDTLYVMVSGNDVAGFIGVSNCNKRTIMLSTQACASEFGRIKGSIVAWQVGKMLSKPEVKDKDSGYIDFLAVHTDFRRKGIGESLLRYVENDVPFNTLYLDVLEKNAPAIKLYKKVGYDILQYKKSLLYRIASIGKMYIMEKEI